MHTIFFKSYLYSVVLISGIFLCSACHSENETKNDVRTNESTQQTSSNGNQYSQPATQETKSTQAHKPAKVDKTPLTNSKLEGSWISDNDAQHVLQMKGSRYMDYYNGAISVKGSYTLCHCADAPCTGQHTNIPVCISVKTDAKEFCYNVLVADGVDLKLILVGGKGNILAFHRN